MACSHRHSSPRLLRGGKAKALTMILRYTTLLLLVTCGCLGLLAQPQVEITITDRPTADSVVDFGVTFVGNHTRRSVSILNRGADTAVLLTNATPFVEFTNLPWVAVDDTRYQNFVVDTPFPIAIPPGGTALVELRYLALLEPTIPLDSAIEAQLRLRVARSFEPTGPFAERQFRLRGRRTTQYLITETPQLRFDSVYVNLNRRLQETFRVRNLQPVSVAIEQQKLDIKTTVVGEPEITADIKPNVVVGGLDAAFWDIYYQPRNLGFDSAVFTIQYRLDTTSGPITLDTRISGVGVEQRLRIVDVLSEQSGSGLRLSGDTIDFGTIASDADSVRALIIVENIGNLDPRILSEQKRVLAGGSASDTASFRVHKTLAEGTPIILRGVRDTLIVTYAPAAPGEVTMRYAIVTDILSRPTIRGVPLGAEVMSFVMTGRQRSARIAVDPVQITFDTVAYSPTCVSEVRDSIRVTNTGDRTLNVSSIRSRGGMIALQISPMTLSIAPSQSAIVHLTFRPTQEGTIADTIDIVSNADQQSVFGVPYLVVALRLRDTVRIGMSDTLAARPGFENVIVDVHVSSPLLQALNRCTLTVNIDTTILRYERTLTFATATETVGVPERINGQGHSLRLAWNSPTAFINRPIFTRLVFSARLGERLNSPLGIAAEATTFGNSTCPDLVPIIAENGVFRIDSLCGLSYKTAMLHNRAMAGVFPNPVLENGTLTIIAPRRERLRAVCVDAFGRECLTVVDGEVDAGTHTFDLSASELPPASYTVIVWSDARYLTVPFVVGR